MAEHEAVGRLPRQHWVAVLTAANVKATGDAASSAQSRRDVAVPKPEHAVLPLALHHRGMAVYECRPGFGERAEALGASSTDAEDADVGGCLAAITGALPGGEAAAAARFMHRPQQPKGHLGAGIPEPRPVVFV
jgi:hypothetical protein